MALILAEALLRFLGVADPRVPSWYREPHRTFGWSLEPGASYRNPLPEQTVRVSYNSSGWRDLERSDVAAADVQRVAVLGDSFMEAYSVNLEDAFHRRLEGQLLSSGHRTEILNFGVGGFGTLQQYLVYRQEAAAYSPDLVVLGFCVANDFRNNSRELEGLLGKRQVKLLTRPFLVDATGSWQLTEIDVKTARKRHDTVLRRREHMLFQLHSRSSFLQLLGTAVSGLRGGADRGSSTLAVHGVHACEETPEYRRSRALTRRILERLRDEVRADGAELFVFTAPARREVAPTELDRLQRMSTSDLKLCPHEAPGYDRLVALLHDLAVPHLNLLPAFRQHAAGEIIFRNSDRHWNADGHTLAAREVANALGRFSLLNESRTPRAGVDAHGGGATE